MKKMLIGLFLVVALVIMGTTSVFAFGVPNQNGEDGKSFIDRIGIARSSGLSYANNYDEKKDIDTEISSMLATQCRMTVKHYNCNYRDDNGDGICDDCGIRNSDNSGSQSYGRYYTDSDGDGVCDNFVTRQFVKNGAGHHSEAGYHNEGHHHHGEENGHRHGR